MIAKDGKILLVKVGLSHIVVERPQLGEHHEALVPDVLDLLVDEERVAAHHRTTFEAATAALARLPHHILFENLLEFVLIFFTKNYST